MQFKPALQATRRHTDMSGQVRATAYRDSGESEPANASCTRASFPRVIATTGKIFPNPKPFRQKPSRQRWGSWLARGVLVS